jgi:hypothetical protein
MTTRITLPIPTATEIAGALPGLARSTTRSEPAGRPAPRRKQPRRSGAQPGPGAENFRQRLVAGYTRIEDAACAGRWLDFDPGPDGESNAARYAREQRAISTCRRCPALARCEELPPPPTSMAGAILAGRVVPARRRGTAA